MNKVILSLALLLLSFSTILAQYKPPSQRKSNTSSKYSGNNLSERIYFGGGGGFSGGTNYINISITPMVGYKITEELSAGVQLSYQYVKLQDFRLDNYGGGPFVRYNVSEKLFGYTEYEYLNFGAIDAASRETLRLDFTSWFVGLGYSEPISDRWAINILALYNILYSDGGNSPYNSPLVFRVGLVGGLF